MAVDTSKLTEKAREAVQRRNYEYAIDLFQQALALNPEDVESRRDLRAVATRYVKEKGISPSAAWLKGLGSVVKLMFSSAKNAEKTIIECEKFLKNDPGNVWVLTKLGMAAMTLGYNGTAVQVFDEVRTSHPANVTNLHNLASAYEAAGDVNAAIRTCDQLLKVKPNDHEASQKIKNLSAMQTSQVFEVGAKEGSKKIVKDDKVHEKYELDSHDIRTVEQRDRAVAFQEDKLAEAESKTDDPRHLATFHGNIGDLWLTVEPDFAKADAAYKRARELQPTDFTYVFKVDDMNIMRFKLKLGALNAKLKASPTDASIKAEIQKLRAQYNAFRMKSFEKRVEVRPMDLAVGYSLGNIYYEMGKLEEAIGQFQRTVNDPARRKNSLLLLGICFSRKQQHELAAKQFTQGLSEIEVMNEMKKTLLYHLGDTCEKMGNKDEAVKAFTQLYEADISFKDVSKRIDALK
ncbi:MAG: tetratricopeptide repeat protein [Planctomycetota bacterium]|jgi:tetratricopeptide (TPR) repeat protein